MLDFLIVGGGLAGSTVAFKLQQKGAKIVQIADVSRPTSSQVAGGMFNPITGKYLTKTWLAEDLYAALFVHYKDIEDRFQASFFFPIGVKRLFNNPENKAHFLGQIVKNNLQDWVEEIPASTRYLQGGLMIKQSGWVNVDAYVHTLRSYFIDLGIFSNQQFDYSALEIHPDFVTYKGIKAQKIIFSEGFYVKDNPWFNILPFNPVKGEVIEVVVKNYTELAIVNQGKWAIPVSSEKLRIGATYTWHELDFEPTSAAQHEIMTAARKIGIEEFTVVDHKAGVRPATVDRRPIMGSHPVFKNVLIFNGLGTKGVSIAPYFADEFVGFLTESKHLNPEVNIERFYSLYS